MSKKIPIIIICILLLIIVVLLFIFKDDLKSDNKNSEVYYLVIGDDTIWSYDGKWKNTSYQGVNNKSMDVYIDSNYVGLKTLKYGSKWNIFSGNNYEYYEGNMLAISNDFGTLVKFSITDIDNADLKKINNILKLKLSLEDISIVEKVSIDLNNDGKLDSIVNVSNLDSEDEVSYFNLVYTVIDGEVNVLINEVIDVKDYFNAPIYNVNYILNIDKENYIVIKKGYFSDAGKTGNNMYQLIDGKYELVIED